MERTGRAPESTEVETPRAVGRSVPHEENAIMEYHGEIPCLHKTGR